MKKLLVLAALLMATPSAYADNSISFQIEGHRSASMRRRIAVRCPASRYRLPASPAPASAASSRKAPATIATLPNPHRSPPAPAPAAQAATPQPAAPVASTAPAVSPAPAAPTTVATASPTPSTGYEASSAPAVAPAAAPAAAPPPAPVAAAPAPTPTTPLGIWATEENKGNVRIEECGQNLCGYAVKTGKKFLINMKPQASKWTGTIYDLDSGRNYDLTIAMKGTNALKVQGCAFGGMFCGGQTWKRVS